VPGLGPSRINAAYGYGFNNAAELYGPEATPREAGMAHAATAVEQFLGIPIDHIAQVNFDGFAGVVDALGGVTIDVPRPLIDDEYPTPDFGIMRVEFAAGPQHMDGARALIYARTRHADSDFGRAERQQQVLRAILDELRRRGPVGQALLLPRLRERIGGAVVTTLPFDRPDALLGLARLASALRPDEIQRAQIAPDTVTLLSEEGGTLIWDEQGVRTLAQQLLRGPSAESEAARVQVLNGTGVSGLAGRVSNDLAGRGFSMLPAGDSPLAASRTVVYNLHDKPITARQLADLLRAELREGPPEGLSSDADIVVVLGEDAAER
jgi:LCP family protein required for cell wall assembly